MQTQDINVPNNIKIRAFCVRLGKIFFNLSIVLLLLSYCSVLSFMATAVVAVVAFAIIVLSVGTIFIAVPNFAEYIGNILNVSVSVNAFFLNYWYIFIPGTILCSILSLVLLLLNDQRKNVARIVISSIIIALALLGICIILLGVLS